MHLITGDETGLVRLISTEKKDFLTFGDTQSRTKSVLSMQWLTYNERFALLRANGDIETYEIDLDDKENGNLGLLGTFTSLIEAPLKITRMDSHCVLCHNANGEVDVVRISHESTSLDQSSSLFKGENCLRAPVAALVYNDMSSRLACGGQKNDLQVWDASSMKMTWKAKNVPHDEVRLEVPIWITSIAFMPTAASGSSSRNDCSGNIIATGTAHKHIRLYDTRAQRQPCQSWGVGDFRVTSVVPSFQNEQHLYVADCAGGILLYDMRNGRRIRTLNGFDGSVRDMSHDASECSHMAAVSLDRYVKVFDCRNQKNIFQAYLKNRLNCTLLIGDNGGDASASGSESYDSDNHSEADVIEEFVDSDSDDDLEDEEDDEEMSYADIEPVGRKQKLSAAKKQGNNKKQKKSR